MTVHAENASDFRVQQEAGWTCGPWRRPTNNSSHEAGSIHDDRTARELGFRSGTVAGSIHMEQFHPLLLEVFGPAWQQSGNLSLWFSAPSIDGEAVRAMVKRSGHHRRAVRMVTAQGLQVLEGTASRTFDEQGAVRQRLKAMRREGAVRILAPLLRGFEARGLPTRVPAEDVQRRLPIITEVLPAFRPAAGGGPRVVPLSAAVHAMRVFEERLPIGRTDFVGLFGAIEWQWIRGPVLVDRPYEVSGRVVAVMESPRTEMLWTETGLWEPDTGQEVARMLMLSRLLKDSSPLWNLPSESS
ncbi:MAG: hypothetical protein ACKO8N_09005 [Rubrivivax sp.]